MNYFQLTLALCMMAVLPTRAFSPLALTQSPPKPSITTHALQMSANAAATESVAEGLIKTVAKQGNGVPLQLGDIATVKYSCYLPNEPKIAPFAKASQQKVVVGDGTMIPGWEKAIRTMRVGERAVVRISDPNLGYGSTGVPPLIPPQAEIELDLEVLDAQAPTADIDFDSLAMTDSTPRTADQIAAAYDLKMGQKALEPKKEGLEGWIEKAKNFYFFGFFEGETGQRAPWFLRPSITFPIAFVIVGAAFWVAFISGAITERGAQITDELDEVILSSITGTDPATGFLLAMNVLLSGSGIDLNNM